MLKNKNKLAASIMSVALMGGVSSPSFASGVVGLKEPVELSDSMGDSEVADLGLQVSGDKVETLTSNVEPENEQEFEPVFQPEDKSAQVVTEKASSKVEDVSFNYISGIQGSVVISLSSSDLSYEASRVEDGILITIDNAILPKELVRELDVTSFRGPIDGITSTRDEGSTKIKVNMNSQYAYDHSLDDGKIVVNIVKALEGNIAEEGATKSDGKYSGKRITLDSQDIKISAVLQFIADISGKDIVVSDSVTGTVTLKLVDVPYDQVLDIILKTKGLDKRVNGDVIIVAPADEMSLQEKKALENEKAISELAPLKTKYIEIKYAKAREVSDLVSQFSSSRGKVSFDERTNIIMIEDIDSKMEKIERAINKLDVPIRQVAIETRIVLASEDVGESIGAKFGGDFSSTAAPSNSRSASLSALDGSGVFSLGILNGSKVLDVELSAYAEKGLSETVARPKVVTADKKTATIKSGTEIPYIESKETGVAEVSFKEAALSLEVTPQITPDDRILMDLIINQDSVGELTISGPSIDTTEISTQVLVSNGETIVIGGIYKSQLINVEGRVPVLGSLPLVGRLFRSDVKEEEKMELLIFITPRLIKE